MLYRLKNFTLFMSAGVLVGTLVPSNCFASGPLASEAIKRAWNAPSVQQVGFDHTLTTGCVGDSVINNNGNCSVWTDQAKASITSNRGTDSNEGTILMLIAREMNTRGAEFCVTQIQAENTTGSLKWESWGASCRTKAKAWTSYYYPNGAESNCFWLCKDNYYGDKCQYNGTPQSCSSVYLTQSAFDGYDRVTSGGVDIDANIPKFYTDLFLFDLDIEHNSKVTDKTIDGFQKDYKGVVTYCDSGAEYDTVLGITRFTTNGTGAFVAPIAVRSYRHADDVYPFQHSGHTDRREVKIHVSTPYLTASGAETLVCKDGYKYNETGTDCVPSDYCAIQDTETEEREKQPCRSMFSQYDETEHYKIYPTNDKSCYEYRCKGSKGFKSATDHTCVECTGNQRKVNVASNGVCVICSQGFAFNKDDANNDYCSRANEVPLNALLYGINPSDKTKAVSVPAQIADQCWTFTDEEEYKTCINEGAEAAKQKAQTRLTEK